MGFNSDEIQELTLDEIAGTITPEDKKYLYDVIAANQEAYALWEHLHSTLGQSALEEATESMYKDDPQQIIDAVKERRKWIVGAGSVATALVLVSVGWYLVLKPDYKQERIISAKAPLNSRIELKLASGQAIDLSTESQVKVNKVTLNNNNRTLSYTGSEKGDPDWATLNVPAGKDYTVRLSDGTEIQVNAGSSVSFPFTFKGSTREITIKGEAYLNVVKSDRQPFIVHLPGSTVQVLGTAFNVNTYDSGQVKVALVEGSIKMRARFDSLVLKPGYEVNYSQQNGMKVRTFDQAELLSWRKGIYIFDDATLSEVCRIIPRWFGINVVIDNPAIGKRIYFGIIDRNQPIEQFLKNLQLISSTSYYFDREGVLHLK